MLNGKKRLLQVYHLQIGQYRQCCPKWTTTSRAVLSLPYQGGCQRSLVVVEVLAWDLGNQDSSPHSALEATWVNLGQSYALRQANLTGWF